MDERARLAGPFASVDPVPVTGVRGVSLLTVS